MYMLSYRVYHQSILFSGVTPAFLFLFLLIIFMVFLKLFLRGTISCINKKLLIVASLDHHHTLQCP